MAPLRHLQLQPLCQRQPVGSPSLLSPATSGLPTVSSQAWPLQPPRTPSGLDLALQEAEAVQAQIEAEQAAAQTSASAQQPVSAQESSVAPVLPAVVLRLLHVLQLSRLLQRQIQRRQLQRTPLQLLQLLTLSAFDA